MDILVIATGAATGIARWQARDYRCALGRGGIRADKREGDGATPVGAFALRRVLYRPDRVAALRTVLPSRPIAPDDGWCDDANDPLYNRPVRLPYPASAETLWREDALYDIVVVLGHNDDPPIAGLGSAIFLHLARDDYAPTAGCVALARADLLTILAAVTPATTLVVHPSPGRGGS